VGSQVSERKVEIVRFCESWKSLLLWGDVGNATDRVLDCRQSTTPTIRYPGNHATEPTMRTQGSLAALKSNHGHDRLKIPTEDVDVTVTYGYAGKNDERSRIRNQGTAPIPIRFLFLLELGRATMCQRSNTKRIRPPPHFDLR